MVQYRGMGSTTQPNDAEQKINNLFDSKYLRVANIDGEAVMNTGRDEVIVFKRDGTHEYLTRVEFMEKLRKRGNTIDYYDILKMR